jgi:hypothetical protein
MLVATGNMESAMAGNAIRELAYNEVDLVSGGRRDRAIVTSDPVKGSGSTTIEQNIIQALGDQTAAIVQNIGH